MNPALSAFGDSARGLASLWRTDRRALLHEILLIFIASGFVLPNEPIWSDVFYIGIMPLFVGEVLKGRFSAPFRAWPLPLLAAAALVAAFLPGLILNIASRDDLRHAGFWLWNIVCTGLFVFLLADAFCATRLFRERLMRVMIGFGVLNVLISLIHQCFTPLEWQGHILRMHGWGLTRHQILGAVIMGSVLLMAVYRALASRRRYWLAAAAALLFIVLTGSRGPLIGVLAALPVLVGLQRPRVLAGLALVLGAAAAACWLFDGGLVSQRVQEQVARGDSHRLHLWSLSWRQIGQHVWLGSGPTWKLPISGETFPHNLLLSTWLYAGLLGVMALTAYLLSVCASLFAARQSAELPLCLAILVHTFVSAATDFGQLVKGPSPMWYMFWLTTLFAAHLRALKSPEMRDRRCGGRGGPGSPTDQRSPRKILREKSSGRV